MRSNIHIILPIVLALILPGLSIYSTAGVMVPDGLGFLGSWLIAATFLYLLWYSQWFLFYTDSKYRKWGFVLIIAIGFLIWALSKINPEDGFRWYYSLRIILASILFLAIQFALKAQKNISQLQIEKQQLQTENYRVQFKVLRAKIDPHFLFNSLNTLRSMVRQKHANSEKFIISLSDFYRQTLKYNEKTSLPLSEEITVLQSYLFLMKNRNEDAVSININVDEQLDDLHLPTLALQVVVENCFKHNSMTTKQPLKIDIYNSDDQHIVVRNNIQPKISTPESQGFGLEVLRKRYDLMDIQDGIRVRQTLDQFNVHLKLI